MEHEPWLKYQRVATELLSKISLDLGLERLEPEQKVTGKSGTEWALDAKGVAEGSGALVIVEARQRKRRPNQEQIASLAYRIQDTGADGGIVVSPVPFQAGAAKVAAAANIQHVSLTADSTATEYVMQFLNKIFVGLSDSLLSFTETLTAKVTSAACNRGTHEECANANCCCVCHGEIADRVKKL